MVRALAHRLFPDSGAVFDETGAYRYLLWRDFAPDPTDHCLWILLNPSTATADEDDPTIRRCQTFTKLWGFDSCRVVNIFAWRSTDPHVLPELADPIGPDNNAWISREVAAAKHIVCAWGAHGSLHDRSTEVREILGEYERWCFGRTKSGEPLHPLYLPNTSPLVKF